MSISTTSTTNLPNRHLLMVLALIIVTFALYQDIFSHAFVAYDDTRIIVGRALHYSGITQNNLRGIFLDDFPREEPLLLRDLSYLINAHIFGTLNPGGYLLGNLLLHVTAGYLVFVLATKLFPTQSGLAALASVCFVIHPLNCEAVAWISARKDTLYTVFYLIAFLAYLTFHQSSQQKYLVGSLLLFIAALFSKAAAISFLPFLICFRGIMLKESRLTRTEIVFYLGVAMSTASYIWWYSRVLREYGVLPLSGTGLRRDWIAWALVTFESLFFYVTKLLYPGQLAVVYTFLAPGQISKHPFFLALTILSFSGFGYLFWHFRRGLDKRVLLLSGWFVCALLPYLDLAQVGILVANRYAYLASIPFCLGCAWLVSSLLNRFRRPGLPSILLAVLLIAPPLFFLSRQTMLEVKVWRDTESLWENARQQDPDNIAAYVALMGEYLRQYLEANERQSALPLLDKATRIGDIAMNRFSNGRDRYERALHLVTAQLGQIAWYQGNPQKADTLFQLTFKLNPDYRKGRYLYATVLAEQHRNEAALQQLALILAPPQKPGDQGISQAASILRTALTTPPSPSPSTVEMP